MIEWGFKFAGLLIKACWYIITLPFQLFKLSSKSSKNINKPVKKTVKYDDLSWIDELEMYDAIFDGED